MPSRLTLAGCAASLLRQGWTQHADARTEDGSVVEPWSARALAWSLPGALVAALERLKANDEAALIVELAEVCTALASAIDADDLAWWNDSPDRTQADVVAAIEAAEVPSAYARFSAN